MFAAVVGSLANSTTRKGAEVTGFEAEVELEKLVKRVRSIRTSFFEPRTRNNLHLDTNILTSIGSC